MKSFFLESWANGDPALLAQYPDDPSGVHHSYLGDRVKFRNLHAGPKETHIFHLHGHQWLAQEGSDKGSYLDSQTIAPLQGFSYNIYYEGSGNRNLTAGDSIFHCHLYPHFAQGMWELWRVHDVFEDGSRFLPDGGDNGISVNGSPIIKGIGTDPLTGLREGQSGTPIPAVVPIPGIAMAPMPTYSETAGETAFPGYPFYIPGKPGHRPPQPPLDLVKNGGLPRHIVTGGLKTTSELKDPILFDFSVEYERLDIEELPQDGTSLEKVAMNFHAKGSSTVGNKYTSDEAKKIHGYERKTPEGDTAWFVVNGLAATGGAPFADPCPPSKEENGAPWWSGPENYRLGSVDYRVSAIELDLIVNSAGWHDPQARINVLDKYVNDYEDKKRTADPFFFRVNSGNCVNFYHTNRTPGHLKLDDFQVETPTDTIGQHIHLVKFDVTSSDGSGNGFNYEDGTFSQDEIKHRIEATKRPGGSVKLLDGNASELTIPGKYEFQQTVQRWWADPLISKTSGKDRAMRTVFTHDHFAPSSIQQHGFYNAMVIEPQGSKWYTSDKKQELKPGEAVGTQAIIETKDPKDSYREFMMAIADFALLYDRIDMKIDKEKESVKNTINNKVAELAELPADKQKYFKDLYELHGLPIDPPTKPEAISTDHHNPYLVNYKNEPIPLRIGEINDDGTFKKWKEGNAGDMAYVFDSEEHGDPFTEIFKAYEGDKVQVRVIQGAQEVQHTMTIHGMKWNREVDNEESPYINAQEIGISEHFELEIPKIKLLARNLPTNDYLYHFGSIDDIWNGAWGFVRSFKGTSTVAPVPQSVTVTDDLQLNIRPKGKNNIPYLLDKDSDESEAEKCKDCEEINNSLALMTNNPKGMILTEENGSSPCPEEIIFDKERNKSFDIEAWAVRDLLPVDKNEKGVVYNEREDIFDPSGLMFVKVKENGKDTGYVEKYKTGKDLEPLILRVNVGDCVKIFLKNMLPDTVPDHPGNAELPKIVNLLNGEKPKSLEGMDPITNADMLPPSSNVSMHPQLVSVDVTDGDGANVGYNDSSQIASRNKTAIYTWYAKPITEYRDGHEEEIVDPLRYLPGNLTSFGDIIKHGTHGLIGALIIEPKDAEVVVDPNTDAVATVTYTDKKGSKHSFKEFVVIYQDGLNLVYKDKEIPIPDCHICDDSYDLGEKGVNYRTEPFWARLIKGPVEFCNGEEGNKVTCDTNKAEYPPDFFLKPKDEDDKIETPTFTAKAGERVIFRVLQPAGRARQRSFNVYGHDYLDYGMENFGSPGSSLISAGKGINADLIGGANEGRWLYRDGPAFMFSGGVWGKFEVEPKEKN